MDEDGREVNANMDRSEAASHDDQGFKAEKGRLMIIKKCEIKWCKVKTSDYSGWIKVNNTWGKN